MLKNFINSLNGKYDMLKTKVDISTLVLDKELEKLIQAEKYLQEIEDTVKELKVADKFNPKQEIETMLSRQTSMAKINSIELFAQYTININKNIYRILRNNRLAIYQEIISSVISNIDETIEGLVNNQDIVKSEEETLKIVERVSEFFKLYSVALIGATDEEIKLFEKLYELQV